ncbi:type II secretion system F family protein [Agromyces archimandritae]|uniref:Type II secretion system F family protein n=1 Tax=Agromyces archimandritae TaxID=2781962 RepID=A0A975FLI7_9MICO|nr:type II secretion system F family protein [Agromyces archimandritae]QTX04315.1 type II secretion system F family protein [Agromyces archimandritae]
MTALALGALLGLGLLLVASPFLWPAGARTASRKSGLADRVTAELSLAGLERVPIPAVVAVCLFLGVVAAALVQAILGLPVLALVAGLLGAALPAIVIHRRAAHRRAEHRAVWPDVVDHLVSSVRSGMSLPDAVGSLAELGPAPTRRAFAAFEHEYRASGNFAVCLERLKGRLADPVADRILETLRMAREVGGTDLTAVLRGLAGYLREDAALRAEVVARQSWIRNAARLGVAAPWLLLLLLASRPEAIASYNSPAGTGLLIAGVVITFVAYRSMVALGRIPEERRWFR